MFLVVGLGNPGKQYVGTRHNVGFMVLDALENKPENVVFLKPKIFMNNSGDAVKNKNPEKLIVIHDDIDLPLGTIRISKGATSAGHKGVESIIKTLDTLDFIRIRVGIRPEQEKPKNVEIFVLEKFTKREGPLLEKAIKNSLTALDAILQGNIEKAMSEYNT